MAQPDKPLDDSRAIRRVNRGFQDFTIQTPDGPAVVQVIDGGPSGDSAQRGGGRGGEYLSAVMRRWWLVLLVAMGVGGGGLLIANRLVKPTYEVDAMVLYHAMAPSRGNGMAVATDPAGLVRTYIELLTRPEIALIAARNPELQQALPWLKGLDLNHPSVQREVAQKLRGICEAAVVRDTELVQIHTEKPDGAMAAAVANAFAEAFVEHVSERLLGRDAVRRRKLQEQVDQQDNLLSELMRQRDELASVHDFETRKVQKTAMVGQIVEYQKLKSEAEIKEIAAEVELARFVEHGADQKGLSSELQLARRRRMDEERKSDALLQATMAERANAENAYWMVRASGKLDEHRDVIMARERIKRAAAAVAEREAAIAVAIDAKVAEEQMLMVAASCEQAQARLREAKAQVELLEKRLAEMDQETRALAMEQQKAQRLDDAMARLKKQNDELWEQLQAFDADQHTQPDAVILVAERADAPLLPTDDKRVKVQAASLIGGLFLGILLALVVDKFDHRVRHPRDIERMLGAPVLGMIPKIQELQRVKGAQTRSFIAEEFRLIRTQLLFNDTSLAYKTICITSPSAGDGKTSLAVNLAISLARGGRRVLLVDADLRKPDVHRIFNISEAPGLGELMQRTADAAAAIRRSDIEMLDVLPAGRPLARPCELLSSPQTRALLEALGEPYDYVILDSAPLLPVSDTQVLLAIVDGVICAFGPDCESDALAMTEEILKRGRASLIGIIANQVRYRQSTSYYRGRAAYAGYYGRPSPAEAPPESNGAGPAAGQQDLGPRQERFPG
jgi:tyrosine-protein kinase Etk/Wzc